MTWQGAKFTIVILSQIPDYRRQKVNRRFHKKVALSPNPFPVQSHQDGTGRFCCIGNISHGRWFQGVTPVAPGEVIKINDVKFRRHGVPAFVLKPGIVGNSRKIVELKIIDEHRKTLPDMLGNDVTDHKVGLT